MDEEGAPRKAQNQTGSIHKLEARMCNLSGIQIHCPSMHGRGKKTKVQLELNLARNVKENKKVFLSIQKEG